MGKGNIEKKVPKERAALSVRTRTLHHVLDQRTLALHKGFSILPILERFEFDKKMREEGQIARSQPKCSKAATDRRWEM